MTRPRLALLTTLALLAFAGNSLLCRYALRDGGMDAASFTTLRLAAGAAMLVGLVALSRRGRGIPAGGGDWLSALALFAYATAFSFAYLGLDAASGALLLFGAVQATMLARGYALGERLRARQWLGVLAAAAGLAVLLRPGLQAPSWPHAALMLLAGVAWGAYSLRGRASLEALPDTAGNFLRTLPMAMVLLAFVSTRGRFDSAAVLAAIASGALASGVGYALWYAALPSLRASSAGLLQLSVPLLAALGGIVLLDEPPGWRFALAAALTLGGIALATLRVR